MRKILFYETESGQKPIEDFLDQLPAKIAQKVTWVLKLIEDLERVPSKYIKKNGKHCGALGSQGYFRIKYFPVDWIF